MARKRPVTRVSKTSAKKNVKMLQQLYAPPKTKITVRPAGSGR